MVFKILAKTIPEVNKIYKKYFLYIYVAFKIHIRLEPSLKARPARGYSRHAQGYGCPRACVKILKFLRRCLICRRRSAVAIMPQPLGGVSAP